MVRQKSLTGVYSANEYLTRDNLIEVFEFLNADRSIKRHKNVAVVGGENLPPPGLRRKLASP